MADEPDPAVVFKRGPSIYVTQEWAQDRAELRRAIGLPVDSLDEWALASPEECSPPGEHLR